MMSQERAGAGFLTRIGRGLRILKSGDRLPYIPTVDQLDTLAKNLVARSEEDASLRERLLFFAGKSNDSGERFSTKIVMEYGGWVDIIVDDDPKRVAVNIAIGASEDSPFIMINKLAIPDTIIFRTRPITEIRNKEGLAAALESFILYEIAPGEKLDIGKGAIPPKKDAPQNQPAPIQW